MQKRPDGKNQQVPRRTPEKKGESKKYDREISHQTLRCDLHMPRKSKVSVAVRTTN
jgi:hypothetical protein